jgi:hypothetical protein
MSIGYSNNWSYGPNDFATRDEWVDFVEGLFGNLLSSFYEQTDPVDDIDRIYRQQEAQAFMGILDDIAAGTADWRDLASFEVDYLSDVDGFTEFVSESISAAQYQGLYSDLENATTNEDFQRIFNEYANAGIETNPYIQNDLASTGSATAVLTGTIDNSILEAAIKKAAMGDGDIVGTVEFEDLPGYGGIWEGLIRHVKVSMKGLNLPIPDWLPLPGIFDLPSIGDIFDTVTGPWKQASKDALRNCMDPDGDGVDDKSASECLEEQSVIDILVEGIGNATEGIWEATGGKVQEAFEEDGIVDRCTSNPSGCAQEVFDKLKDIFGEGAVDPTSTGGNIPDWMKVIIIGGAYGDEILGELEDLFGGDINDDGTIGVGPEEPQPFDCATVGKFNPDGGASSEADCIDPCQYDSNIPSTSPECQDPAPNGYCEDGTTPKDNPQGTNCEEYEPPLTPEEQQCDEQGRVFNDITGECEETCANPEHVVGADGNCGPPEAQTCDNGAENYPDCSQCSDGSTPDQHQGGNCNNPLIDPNDPFNCAAGRPEGAYSFETQAWDRNCGADYCYNGTPKQTVDGVYGANCEEYVAPQPQEGDPCDSTGNGQNDGTIVNGECVPTTTGEECANGATNYPECDQCPTGQSLVDGQCTGITTPECDQQDRVTNADGSCGECKPGFIEDPEGFDQCIQAPPECNDCTCAEYAAANPVECTTCPEGQEYCEATGACATAEECAAATDDGTDDGTGGGGGSGGGGGRSMFQPYSFAISADPQLLSRSEFPITDFLAGIFTNSRGGRNV